MNFAQAFEHANAAVFPGFLTDDASLDDERRKNEEAIVALIQEWEAAPLGDEPCSFDTVLELADRNREICDIFGEERLRTEPSLNLPRRLSDADLVHGVAVLQKRRKDSPVARIAGPDLTDLGIAFLDKPIKGTVVGLDIETTATAPDRGYILNLGFAFMDLTPTALPSAGYSAYFSIPEIYCEKGVPLADIHQITWDDIADKPTFRESVEVQKALLEVFRAYPVMAHNASFEDAWLKLHLAGYAEARKAGEITVIDSRDICRRLDVDARSLPRESAPAALENWARRRGVLSAEEKERHLGLDDVFLMLKTVQAEFSERNMFPGQKG